MAKQRLVKGVPKETEVARAAELLGALEKMEAILAGTSSIASVFTLMLLKDEVIHVLKQSLGKSDEIEEEDGKLRVAKKLICRELKCLGQLSKYDLRHYFDVTG
eukprot:538516-Rhodomonas_salina.1